MPEVPDDVKISIIKKLMEVWTSRPNDTLMKVCPSNWPENIRNCNLQEFIATVFNSNPKAVTDIGIQSADAYTDALQKSFGSSV